MYFSPEVISYFTDRMNASSVCFKTELIGVRKESLVGVLLLIQKLAFVVTFEELG